MLGLPRQVAVLRPRARPVHVIDDAVGVSVSQNQLSDDSSQQSFGLMLVADVAHGRPAHLFTSARGGSSRASHADRHWGAIEVARVLGTFFRW